MKKKFLLIVFASAGLNNVYAQVGVNTKEPHSNAVLDLRPNKTTNPAAKTLILPQLPDQKTGGITPESNSSNITATNQRDNGMMYFNTDTGCIDYWIASKGNWSSLCGNPPSAKLTTITNDLNDYIYTYNPITGSRTPPSINLLADVARAGGMIITTSEATQNTNGIGYTFNNHLYAGNQTLTLNAQGYPETTGTFEYKALYDANGDGVVDTFVTNKNGQPYTFKVKYQEIIPNQTKMLSAPQRTPGFSNPSFVMGLDDLTIPVKAGQKLDATYVINIDNMDNAFAGNFAFPAITDAAAVPASQLTLTGTYVNKNGSGGTIISGNIDITNRDKNPLQNRGTDINTSGLKQSIVITVTYVNNSASTVDFSVAAVQDINYSASSYYFTVSSASVTYTTTNPGV
ncbi:hypothetical protein [Chryseobacterium sp.]|uniref:hypothetical protein n=1 Tax=Chryseobacterium sp. TaxID=1871047 RepID=UPI0025C1E30F|nr:hypothetical protein [Chryseobacterium sp.]